MTHILQISIGRMDLRTVLVVQWHAPEPVVLDLAGLVQLGPEFVRCGVYARVYFSEGDDDGSARINQHDVGRIRKYERTQ